jgi:hypothetical protein
MQRSSVTPTTYLTLGLCAVVFSSLCSSSVEAQPAPEEAQPPAALEATPTPAAPAPPTLTVTEAPAAPAAEVVTPPVEPPAAVEVPPPPKPEAALLKLNAWMHLTNRVQNLKKPEKVDRFSQENVLNLIASGQVVSKINYQAALAGAYGPISPDSGSINGSVTLLDLIGQLDLNDAFHIWFGRMLVPSDRANFTGFWFSSPWYYPGGYYDAVSANNHFFGAPVGPRQGPSGRNDGATVWGEFGGGLFKYYVGAYDTFSAANNPLISSRINLALISPEPGYYHSSTYYGSKDILAIGASAQFQKSKGSAEDYSEVSVDVLFEKNLKGAGTIDLDGAFYKYYASAIDFSYYVVASYLTPDKVGAGFLQPLVRLQQAKPVGGDDTWTIFEAQLGYIVAQDAARLALGYQWQKAGGVKSNALYLGLQLLK